MSASTAITAANMAADGDGADGGSSATVTSSAPGTVTTRSKTAASSQTAVPPAPPAPAGTADGAAPATAATDGAAASTPGPAAGSTSTTRRRTAARGPLPCFKCSKKIQGAEDVMVDCGGKRGLQKFPIGLKCPGGVSGDTLTHQKCGNCKKLHDTCNAVSSCL
jgi:hypothetical protein